jgi:hypothetical protein
MQKTVLSLLFGLCTLTGVAQATMLDWVATLNGSGFIFTNDIHLDEDENVYVCGRFTGTTDFDPSGEVLNLSAAGEQDGFVGKYDTDGNLVWALKVGGTGDDQITGVGTDPNGNVYVTGFFTGSGDFDPGEEVLTLTSAGNRDFFVLKLDSDGNLVWHIQIGDTSTDESNDLAVDSNGNIFVTGRFTRNVDFDPGPGTAILDNFGSPPDVFILKLNSDGEYQWAEKLGVGNPDSGTAIELDPNGDVIVSGLFTGMVDFDPGPGTTEFFGTGLGDVFFTKYSSEGAFMWATATEGDGFTTCQDLAIDTDGNIYGTGWFTNEVTFKSPNGANVNLTSLGAEDSFVSKISPNGQLEWVRQLGGQSLDWSYSIAVDILGDVYTTGFFYDTADFDPGAGTANLTSESIEDIFLSKLTTDGDFVWAKRMGGAGSEAGYGIKIGNTGDIYTLGTFFQTADLDPEDTQFNVSSSGGADGYIVKIDQTVISSIPEIVAEDLAIFPNPSAGALTIQSASSLQNAVATLRTLDGKWIAQYSGLFGEQVQLDLSTYTTGIYIIEIRNGADRWLQKWLKL